MKIFWHIVRILLGLVFIFSGFVKGIDPWGISYKFTDYFNAWNMESLTTFAFPLGIFLSAAEFITGIALVFNIFTSFFSLIALLFMAFFTVLTLIVAIQNPVTDCGCFGDALILTNWQTFYKNIFLLVLAVLVFLFRKKYKPLRFQPVTTVMAVITIMVFVYLIDYSYKHLPIIDFRPYKIGTNIPEAMIVPADAPVDVYENTFYYKNKNTGNTQKFNQENYPWQDSLNWEFVSMEDPVLVKKGYEPPIHNFFIETDDGEDIKDFFLYDENYTFFWISHNLEKADRSKTEKTNQLAISVMNKGMNFIGLTSSMPEGINKFISDNKIPFDIFNADEITLKTMIRSNPGLILLKHGTIMDKWHVNDIPDSDEIEKELDYFKKLDK